MAFSRLTPGYGPNDVKTLMGWNQRVRITGVDSLAPGVTMTADQILRVSDYSIGSNQEGNAPDYVTGATDRTAYTRGPVTIQGNFNYPITIEAGSGTVSGWEFFKAGALLATQPTMAFSIQGGEGENVGGCKVNVANLSVNAEEAINGSAEIWGISDDATNVSRTGGTHAGADYDDGVYGPNTLSYGEVDGADVTGKFTIVQIPMWDSVKVVGAPDGMFITGVSINVNNNLQRNYTLGNELGASPWGLNATSISANQRTITGNIMWQSDYQGDLKAILGTGIKTLNVYINNVGSLEMQNVLWNAVPPTLSTGDRVVIETSFTALGNNGTFDALTVTDA